MQCSSRPFRAAKALDANSSILLTGLRAPLTWINIVSGRVRKYGRNSNLSLTQYTTNRHITFMRLTHLRSP